MMTVPMDSSSAPPAEVLAQRLFKKNIELENGLRKLAQEKILSDPSIWLQMRENYETIILEDHEFLDKHKVEFMLWQLHYKMIAEFRTHLNAAKTAGSAVPQAGRNTTRPDHIKKIHFSFKRFLSEATGFYHDLIVKISAKYGLPLGYFSECPDSQIILSKNEKKSVDMKKGLLSCHRCLICLGDLARYKGMYGERDSVSHDYTAASSYYMHAASLFPSSGNPHHQLAILASYHGDDLVTIYRYFRSLAVDNPFSTARENLITAFEKNRQRVAQLPSTKAFSAKELPPRSTTNGRNHADAMLLEKESSRETSVKEQDVGSLEVLKVFSLRFIRLHGILFTRTSLETFGDVFTSVVHDLHELLSSGPEEELNFGVDANENGLVFLRLVSIFIFTVHNVNKNIEGQSYTEILQRSVLLQNALFASFEFVGHALKRCIELSNIPSSYLLAGIMIFIEWLASHLDIAIGIDVEERQVTERMFFWNQFVAFMNALLSSGYGYLDTNEDETCFSHMSHYDEGQTGNRLALWEDFELRGFLPLLQAHRILDFSRKHSAGSDGTSKEIRNRVQRIIAAGRALMNVVRIDQKRIYFDQHLKKFVFGNNPPAIMDNELASLTDTPEPLLLNNATSPAGSLSNMGEQQAGTADFGLTLAEQDLYLDGDDDEEEIVFKPTVSEKYPDIIAGGSTYKAVQPLHVSSTGGQTGSRTPYTSSFHNSEIENITSSLDTSNPDISLQALQQLNFNTSKWLVEKEEMLSGLKNMSTGSNLLFQGGLSSLHPSALVPHSTVPTSSVSSDQVTVADTIIPSPLDFVVPHGTMSNGLPLRNLTPSPIVSKQNPVSRLTRHVGPPGFNDMSSKQQDGSMNNSAAKYQNLNNDDYSGLDGYQQSSIKQLVDNIISHASVMLAHSFNDYSSEFSGFMDFLFLGKQMPPVQTKVGTEMKWQDFELF